MTRPRQSQSQERSAASSGQMQKPGRSGSPQKGIIVDDDEMLTSPVKITPEENDPFLFALDELNFKEKAVSQATNSFHSSGTKQNAVSSHTGHDRAETGKTIQKTESETDAADNPIEDVFPVSPWHKQVPTWFWVLFAVSATGSIGLVAVLAAILIGRL